jgi:hypothetical protein
MRRQAGVEVVGAVGKVGEDLPSSVKVAAVEPCPENHRSELAPERTSVGDGAAIAGSWSPAASGGLRSYGSWEG